MRAALFIATLEALCALAVAEEGLFKGWFSLNRTTDSIWVHCELDVHVNEQAKGVASVECQWEGGATEKNEGHLSETEVSELRTLLQQARLFEGQFWGHDPRGVDAALVTITASDDQGIATLVCTGNESFDSGARQGLIGFLNELNKKVSKRGEGR